MDDLERTAIETAYKLRALEGETKRLRETTVNLDRSIHKLRDDHQSLKEAVIRSVAAAEATREAAEKAAANVLSTKHLYIAVALMIVSIIGLVVGVRTQ
jgi:uncharacterized coiled-coil DUF342 family protein